MGVKKYSEAFLLDVYGFHAYCVEINHLNLVSDKY